MAIAKIMFKAQIIYRFDVATSVLTSLGQILFAWLIWGAVFIGRDTVGGFTLQAMLLYYVVSTLIASLDLSWSVSEDVSTQIRGGTFSKFMVIPTNPQWHVLAQTTGATAYYALFAFPVIVISGFLFGAGGAMLSLLPVLIGLIMIPLGIVFILSYHYFIGIMAFKFQDISFFRHMQSAIIQFAQGGIIPLNLLPEPTLNILNLLPFPHVLFTPTMLLTGHMDWKDGLFSLGILSFWTIGIVAAGQLTFKRLRIKYDGVGI